MPGRVLQPSARSSAPAKQAPRSAPTPPIIYSGTVLSAVRFGDVARAHWGVENGLHWVLDVTMSEDQARNRKDNGPQNIALLRRLALNLAKLEGSKQTLKGKLFRAAMSDVFLTRILAQFGRTQIALGPRSPR